VSCDFAPRLVALYGAAYEWFIDQGRAA